MKLIVGLGNPGKQYEKTRHNLGFMVVEQFLKDFEPLKKTVWDSEKKFKSDIVHIEWKPKHGQLEKVILLKPQTYMNNSGMAVKLVSDYFKLDSSDIWVVHDDIDLPLGFLKIRFGGGTAGHHGAESIIEGLGTDKFWRFRIGIGDPSSKFSPRASVDARRGEAGKMQSSKLKLVEDYVLNGFTGGEKGKVREMIKKGSDAIQCALEESLERAMNRYNS